MQVQHDEQLELGQKLISLREEAFKLIPMWFKSIKLKAIKNGLLNGSLRLDSYTTLSLQELKNTPYMDIPLKGSVYHKLIKEYINSLLFPDRHKVYELYQAILRVREELYMRNIKLIYKVMRKMRVRVDDWEEVFSHCQASFLKAIDNWTPQRGTFSTYACKWLMSAIQNYYRHTERTFTFSYNRRISEDDEETFEVFLSTDDNCDGVELEVKCALEKLPEPERTIICMKFYDNYTEREIAKLLGISPTEVYLSLEKGLDTMKLLLV